MMTAKQTIREARSERLVGQTSAPTYICHAPIVNVARDLSALTYVTFSGSCHRVAPWRSAFALDF